MSDKELLDFCKEHNVEVSFRFESLARGYYLRMSRGMFQINDILTVDQIETIKDWTFFIKAILTRMVGKLNKFEEDFKNKEGRS